MKTLKFIVFATVLTSCYSFDDCDCVVVTENTFNHQSDKDFFKELREYCETKDLNGANRIKWNEALEKCANK